MLIVSTGTLHAGFTQALTEGNLTGHLHLLVTQNINEQLPHQASPSTGGSLSYQTARFHTFDLKMTLNTALHAPWAPQDAATSVKALDYNTINLQEAYLQSNSATHRFTLGRQALFAPMLHVQDNDRVFEQSYEAAMYTKHLSKDLTLVSGHVASMLTRGSTTFRNMAQVAGFKTPSLGVSVIALKYASQNLNIELWDNYAHGLFNTLYSQAFFSHQNMTYGIQYLKQDGATHAIKSDYYGLNIHFKTSTTSSIKAAYSYTYPQNSAFHEGSLFMPWGSAWMTLFTSTMEEIPIAADTRSWLIRGDYNANSYLKGLHGFIRLASYNRNEHLTALAKNENITYGWLNRDSLAYDIDITYDVSKTKSFRLRYSYVDYASVRGDKPDYTQIRYSAHYRF